MDVSGAHHVRSMFRVDKRIQQNVFSSQVLTRTWHFPYMSVIYLAWESMSDGYSEGGDHAYIRW